MVDLQHIDELRTFDELCEAYNTTFDPALDLSDGCLFGFRMDILSAAHKLGCYTEMDAYAREYDRKREEIAATIGDICAMCECDRRGKPLGIASNFLTIMRNDASYSSVRYNELTMMPEILGDNGKYRLWRDSDDAGSRTYIEKTYGIHSVAKHNDALLCLFEDRKYHPIKQIIESIKWDGVKRIPYFLTRWGGVEDSEYAREVSRLLFAGGINRLYDPGCKFDDMVVFVGKQGCGKSTLARYLAIQDSFFVELRTLEGKAALEAIAGAWIVEIPELSALTKMREQESIKAFLSALSDKYRPAYARYTITQQRTCAFIGTSNNYQFIADKTGGRRYFPVEFLGDGTEIFNNKAECREYIKQCWAEAYAALDTEYMAPRADPNLKEQIESKQEAASEDDYRIGVIEAYLNRHSAEDVCFGMLWEEALGNDMNKATKSDQTQIGMIMRNMVGWKRCDYKRNFGRHGTQKFWRRTPVAQTVANPTPNDSFPF